MTANLKMVLIKRDRLKTIAVKSGDLYVWQIFTKVRNYCNNQIRKIKTEFYHNSIQANTGNSKEIWKIINQVTSRNTKTDNNVSSLKVGSQVITDSGYISHQLNKHFAEIGPKLASSLETSSKSYTDYVIPQTACFSLKPIESSTVLSTIFLMSGKKAIGLRGITGQLVKESALVISVPLCDLFNLSIQTSIFSNDWKLAKVFPIYKGEANDNLNNYRPISVFSTVSKILGRIVYDQLHEFVNDNNILTKYQSGLRPFYSTTTTLLHATTEWLINMDQERLNSVVLFEPC